MLVLNKIDLFPKRALLPLIERAQSWHAFAAIVPVSALTGDGVDRLERVLLGHLPEGCAALSRGLPDRPAGARRWSPETVREKLLQHTRAELPFSTAVVVDQFDEERARADSPVVLHHLRRKESQKRIVIGRGGEMIKRIGTEARQDLEAFFETKVFLDLHVKVNADWRDNDRVLDDMACPAYVAVDGSEQQWGSDPVSCTGVLF